MIKNPLDTALENHLDYLKLPYLKENCRPFAAEGNTKHWSHIDYLARLIEGEAAARHDRTILHRIKAAHFPLIKTLESFRWDWPKKINQLQIQDLFRLRFIDEKANAIFLGLCGIGKTHLATALGYAACQHGYSVLFANAIDAIGFKRVISPATPTMRWPLAFSRAPSTIIHRDLPERHLFVSSPRGSFARRGPALKEFRCRWPP